MLAPMKIWLKYLIAIGLGAGLSLVTPIPQGALSYLSRLFVDIARYAFVPLAFFSAALAAEEAREDKRLLRLVGRSLAYSALAVFALTGLGVAGAFVLSPARIPLNADSGIVAMELAAPAALAARVFPPSMLSALLDHDYLLPMTVAALVLGTALGFDKSVTKPLATVVDSASRTLWQVNGFVVELFPLAVIALSAAQVRGLSGIGQLAMYGNLFLSLGIQLVVAIFGLLPLLIFLHDRRTNPYRTLYALAGPALLGLVSGHALAPAGSAAKHLKDSLGLRRRAGAISLPVALSFGRAGSAMVGATAFIVVLSSYSSLGISSGTVLWMLAYVPLSALMLSAAPAQGPLAALVFLSGAYGRGFESGYLLMVPVALPLMAMAGLLDALFSTAAAYAAGQAEGYAQPKPARHYI